MITAESLVAEVYDATHDGLWVELTSGEKAEYRRTTKPMIDAVLQAIEGREVEL